MLTPSTFVVYVDALKDAMFPDGAIKPPEPQLPRTPEQKAASRDAAARSLSAIMPGALAMAACCRIAV